MKVFYNPDGTIDFNTTRLYRDAGNLPFTEDPDEEDYEEDYYEEYEDDSYLEEEDSESFWSDSCWTEPPGILG